MRLCRCPMSLTLGVLTLAFTSIFTASTAAQTLPDRPTATIPLTIPSGAPLRLYLTGRVSKRLGDPVEAKLLESVFAFDREVIPAGTVALGKVSRTESVGKWQRLAAILNGDFTPLRKAQVEFTTL